MSAQKVVCFFVGVTLSVVVFSAVFVFAAIDRMNAVQAEAVERGFAEWVPGKEGNTTFKWKEVAK